MSFLINRHIFLLLLLIPQQSRLMLLSWRVYSEQLSSQTFLIKANINWELRNEIRLFYQPRDSHCSISHSSFNVLSLTSFFNTTVWADQGQIWKRKDKRSNFCLIVGKDKYPGQITLQHQITLVHDKYFMAVFHDRGNHLLDTD